MNLVDPGPPLYWEVVAPRSGCIWDRHAASGDRPVPGTQATAFCGAEFTTLSSAERRRATVQRTCRSCADHAWRLRHGSEWPPADHPVRRRRR